MKRSAAGLKRGSSLTAQALALALAVSWMSPEARAERKYSGWGPAINLGCGVVNSSFDDTGPGISKDGLSLYFGSTRPAAEAIASDSRESANARDRDRLLSVDGCCASARPR